MEATFAIIPDKDELEIRHESIDVGSLGPCEGVVKADTTIVSAGTELANFTALSDTVYKPGNWNTYPWRPGYGLVGRLVAVGDGVENWRVGDRLFCFGRHASYQIVDLSDGAPIYRAVFPLGERLPAEEAVVIRMGLVAITAPQVTQFEAGDTVAVFGLGLVGNLAAQLYQLAGARVIALDPVPGRCDVARESQLKEVINVSPDEQVSAVMEFTNGIGADVVVDAVGHSGVIENCVDACADHGQVILLGTPRAPYKTNMTQVFNQIHLRWLTVRGALEWRLPSRPVAGVKHSTFSNINRLADLIVQRGLSVEGLVSHVVTPEGLLQAYLGLLNDKEHYMGVVVDWRD